jgi:hypothetical protein
MIKRRVLTKMTAAIPLLAIRGRIIHFMSAESDPCIYIMSISMIRPCSALFKPY